MGSVRQTLLPLLRRNQTLHLIAARLYRFLKTLWGLKLRIVFLKNAPLEKQRALDMATDPGYNAVVDDLLAFTGLSESQVRERLLRTPSSHFETEFRWHAPRDQRELTWFYRCSYGYLFANAAHPYWTKLDFLNPGFGRVLDYGGGVGNNVITLARRGFMVDYLEISHLEQAFMSFRLDRRRIRNVTIISPFVDGRFDPVRCISGVYGAIILQDVLEHLPRYDILLSHLIAHLKSGGFIIENSPFSEGGSEFDIHLRETIPLKDAMICMEPIEPGIWRKTN